MLVAQALTNVWRYTTNQLDGVNWQARNYDDSGWPGQGAALLAVESDVNVRPRNTVLPGAAGSLAPTYYFRTHFWVATNLAGFTLLFSNYVDDGAVFYLNGTEVQRLRLPPPPYSVTYRSLATDTPLSGDAVSPDMFRLAGDLMTNLMTGDNVLAVEVHQAAPSSSDVVFGSAVSYTRQWASEIPLRVTQSDGVVCISWSKLRRDPPARRISLRPAAAKTTRWCCRLAGPN